MALHDWVLLLIVAVQLSTALIQNHNARLEKKAKKKGTKRSRRGKR